MNKKNLMYMGILAVLVVLFLFNKTKNHTEEIEKLFATDSTKIGMIEISSIKDTVRLVQQSGEWNLEYPIKFPANKLQVKNFFSKVLKAEMSNIPVSENKDSWNEFKVTDSLGTLIRLFDSSKTKILEEVYVGQSNNYSNSNVRIKGDKAVYKTQENITYTAKSKVENWRKNKLHDYKQNEIEKISVKGENLDYMLVSTDSLWQFNDTSESISIKEANPKLSTVLNGIENLQTREFIDGEYAKYKEKFETPLYFIEMNIYDGTSIKFFIIAQDDEKKKFIIKRNDESETLFVVGSNILKPFIEDIDKFKE